MKKRRKKKVADWTVEKWKQVVLTGESLFELFLPPICKKS